DRRVRDGVGGRAVAEQLVAHDADPRAFEAVRVERARVIRLGADTWVRPYRPTDGRTRTRRIGRTRLGRIGRTCRGRIGQTCRGRIGRTCRGRPACRPRA